MTPDEIEDRFESISFRPPRTFAEMKAWDHFAKYDGPYLNICNVFNDMGISPKKVHQYLNKIEKGLTKKENLEYLAYIGSHSFDIRVILSYFRTEKTIPHSSPAPHPERRMERSTSL
jgi:hypothetical protein